MLVERLGREGLAVASADGVTVALDIGARRRAHARGPRAYDLIRQVNTMRKEQGFELTDRIVLTVPRPSVELADLHGEGIKSEVLAVEIRVAGDELWIEKA